MSIKRLEDFFTYMEQDGMVCKEISCGLLYQYPSHREWGHVKVLGEIDKWYYIEHDYESPHPLSMEIQIEEQYVNISIIDHFEYQHAAAYISGQTQELPAGARFFINNAYAPRGLMHAPAHVRQRRRSIVIRERTYLKYLSQFLSEIQSRRELDIASLLEQAGHECMHLINNAITPIADGRYEGYVAKFCLESVVMRFLADWIVQMEHIARNDTATQVDRV